MIEDRRKNMMFSTIGEKLLLDDVQNRRRGALLDLIGLLAHQVVYDVGQRVRHAKVLRELDSDVVELLVQVRDHVLDLLEPQ